MAGVSFEFVGTQHLCKAISCNCASPPPSLRAKRSNPYAAEQGGTMDCFVASLLATTVVSPDVLNPRPVVSDQADVLNCTALQWT
jgi:hypothetical protein